jgi:signal transduction histidine kinase
VTCIHYLRFFLVCAVTATFSISGSNAQSTTLEKVPGYNITHFTDENGLPQNSVKSIVKDERGYIWMTTERGLIRYDGHRLVKFDQFGDSYASRNIYGFQLHPSNPTNDLLAMTHEGKWIRIANGEARIDSNYKGYPAYEPSKDPAAREDPVIQSLPFVFEDQYENILSRFISIYPFPAGSHYVYHQDRVSYYHKNKLVKRFFFPKKDVFNFFRLDNDLYFLDKGLSLFRFTSAGSDSSVHQLPIEGEILRHLARQNGFMLFWNNVSDQVFVLLDKSLYLLSRSKSGAISGKLILNGFDLRKHSVKAVYYDPLFQRIYMGSQLEGLYIAEKQPFDVVADPKSKANIFYGQTLLGDDQILTPDGKTFNKAAPGTVLSGSMPPLSNLVNWDLLSVLRTKSGHIWTKQGEEIFQFDSRGNSLISKWLIKGGVTNLYEGLKGRIWIGTKTKGLYYLDPGRPQANPSHFPCKLLPQISWIEHQGADFLWIGTGKGLYRLHLPTGKLSPVAGLDNIYIRSLHIPTGSAEVWITTYTSGFFLLKENKLTRFPLDKQQHLASAHCIFEDKNGFFWITTNRGLFQIKKSDLLAYVKKPFIPYYHYYAKSAGFKTNEFNGGCQPCAVRMRDGTVSFPSINGLVWFVPEHIKAELPSGQIFIDNLNINGKASASHLKHISVQAGASEVDLKVSTPYFGDRYNLKMSYRAFRDGTPISNWKEFDENTAISIPFTAGGKYTVSIRKLNGFGPNNYGYNHLNISIDKQWFETWWFKMISALAILALFYITLKLRIRAVKKQNELLETKVNERTLDLEHTLRVLNNSEKQLEEQLRLHIHMIASISHDVRTPIRHMSYALDHTYALMEKDQINDAKNFVIQLKQGVERIYSMVDNIVNFIRPEIHGPKIGLTPVGLRDVVDEKVLLFKQIANSHYGNIVVDISPDTMIMTDAKLLGIIIHNLIDNAIKIQHKNKIRIYTDYINGHLHLIFEDDGPGMPPALTQWLNSNEFFDNHNLQSQYEGIGLLMIKQISQILNLDLSVENKPGACIHVIFNEKTEYQAQTTIIS